MTPELEKARPPELEKPRLSLRRVATIARCAIAGATLSALLAFTAAPPAAVPTAPAEPTRSARDLYKSAEGPFAVKTVDETWKDGSRNRTIPVRIYIPEPKTPAATAADPKPTTYPVIIFSHGLGASRANYGWFGEHMASHGYIVIAPTHAGSDTAAMLSWRRKAKSDEKEQGWLLGSIADPDNRSDRPKDISFIIDEIPKESNVKAIADLSRIGVAGHSFGAYTACAIGGMLVDLPATHGGAAHSFRDPRVRAVLPMSPQGPGTMGITTTSFSKFGAPVLFLTGTRDYGNTGQTAAWRRFGFEGVHGVDDYLITLDDATHMTFGTPTITGREGSETKATHAELVRSISAAFMDAYVRDDATAKAWLQSFAKSHRADCEPEFKPAAAPAPPPSTVPPPPPPAPPPVPASIITPTKTQSLLSDRRGGPLSEVAWR